MKYVISFFICLNVFAAPIKIFHEKVPGRANIVKDIFTQQYKVPEDLIEKKETQDCENLKSAGNLDLCLKKNGDLLVVSVNRRFVSESLKIFNTP